MVAASIRRGETGPLSVAVTHTVALGPFAPMLRELSRAFPGLQLKLRRGSGRAVAEYLSSGIVELAIAGPLGESWSPLDTLPLFEEPFGHVATSTHRPAGSDKPEISNLPSHTPPLTNPFKFTKDHPTHL